MKTANYYASSVEIPEHIEKAIADLPNRERLFLVSEILRQMRGDDCTFLATNELSNWLRSQSYDSLLSVLKWITSELL